MITYDNCDTVFGELKFKLEYTHIYSTGYANKHYTKGDIEIMFHIDNKTKENEFIIGKGEREVVYIGKLSSKEFLQELLKNIDYERYI